VFCEADIEVLLAFKLFKLKFKFIEAEARVIVFVGTLFFHKAIAVDPVLDTVIIPNGPPVVSPVPAVSLAEAEIKVGVVCMNVDPDAIGRG
jgi:hypothetical protein